jgi:nicotinate-nucleotide adenylyltransferase
MNIGVIGGTFDPVHLGHLAIAEQARNQLNLAEVIFVPAGNPYFKDGTRVSSPSHRVKMLQLALSGKPYFKISLMEIERNGPSYSIETISALKKSQFKNDELYFILGWDTLVSLHLWYNPAQLMSLCRFAAAPRPGYPRPDTRELEKNLPGISERSVVMDGPLLDISSTQIRARAAGGLSIDDLVPPKVAEYIKENGLYKPWGSQARETGIPTSR